MGRRCGVLFVELRPSAVQNECRHRGTSIAFVWGLPGGTVRERWPCIPEEAAGPARWREVSINRFGDYIRIRRMDDAELLWAADPGDPYPFMVASGHDYRYGDYGKPLAKTAGLQEQLTFKELPNYGSPYTTELAPLDSSPQAAVSKPNYSRGQFFTVNFVRYGSEHLSLQGRIDGADISADLVRINNDDFEFFKTRKGLP